MNAPARKTMIAGNWKLNKTIREAIELVTLLKRRLCDVENTDVVVCPPYTAISDVGEILAESEIKLGGQDLYWEDKGAFTGEISGAMLKEAGANFVIVGHSERRQFFNETNETVNKKIKAALKNSLTPIVCIGETLEEREGGRTFQVIGAQFKGAFGNFSREEMKKVILAYEPVWAIGTGKVATPQQAQEVHAFIRKELWNAFGEAVASGLRILYGGSVKPGNISDLIKEVDIDGALVGGASLEADQFSELVKQAMVIAPLRGLE